MWCSMKVARLVRFREVHYASTPAYPGAGATAPLPSGAPPPLPLPAHPPPCPDGSARPSGLLTVPRLWPLRPSAWLTVPETAAISCGVAPAHRRPGPGRPENPRRSWWKADPQDSRCRIAIGADDPALIL